MATKRTAKTELNNDNIKSEETKKRTAKPRIMPDSKRKTLAALDENPPIEEVIKRGEISTKEVGNAVVVKNVAAPSEEQLSKIFKKRPYWSITQMPYAWLEQKIINYFNSITVDVVDDNGNVIAHKYTAVPTVAGLAAYIGVDSITLRNYVQGKQFKSVTKPYALNALNDNNLDNLDAIASLYAQMPINYDNSNSSYINYSSYNNNSKTSSQSNRYKNLTKEQRKRVAEENAHKFLLVKKAYQLIESFHEARLGTNENVSGSIFALLNMNRGWKNDHKVSIEHSGSSGNGHASLEEIKKGLAGLGIVLGEESEPIELEPNADGEWGVSDSSGSFEETGNSGNK